MTVSPLILSAIALVTGSLAVSLSIAAIRASRERFISLVLSRRMSAIEVEQADLRDKFDSLTRLVKRANSRQAMAKAREKKNSSEAAMTDEEWRKWATKRIQQGQPIN